MMDRDLDDLQVPPGHLQDGLAMPGHGSDQPALLPLSTLMVLALTQVKVFVSSERGKTPASVISVAQ